MASRTIIVPGILMMLLMLTISCSGSDPVTGNAGSPNTSAERTVQEYESSHYLWTYNLVYVNLEENEFELIPVRQVADHWNVLRFLEQGPCTDCLKITNLEQSGYGTLLVDIEITHPFDNANLTGFDVRGIAMFSGSHVFPASGLNMSDRSLGDGALVNPDGATTLYNFATSGSGPGGLEGYIEGELATMSTPDTLLNCYKRFVSAGSENTRNALYAGDAVTVTYEINMPDGEFIFGYAVDASWAPPLNKPVADPMTDFGPEANCTEAWKIMVTSTYVGDGLTDCGGEAKLTIDVYDWQGTDDAHPVVVECPEFFNGQVEAIWKSDGVDFTSYEAVVENVENAPVGLYKILVSREAEQNDPVTKPWLDLTAYQIIELEVIEAARESPTAVAEASQLSVYVDEIISFNASGSHDNDCGNQSIAKYEWDWNYHSIYDEAGKKVDHSWANAGTYFVQLRVTDDEGQTDILDAPIEISIHQGEDPYDPVDVTPPWLNFSPYGVDVDSNYAYVAGGGNGLHIFDLTDQENPVWVTRVQPPGGVNRVVVSGAYAYITVGDYDAASSGFRIIDIDPPESAYVVHSVDTHGRAADVVVSGTYAYVVAADSEIGVSYLHIIDVDPPESTCIVQSVEVPAAAEGVAVSGGYAFVANGYAGLQIVDIDPPESAYIVNNVSIPGLPPSSTYGVAASGGYAYVASDNGLMIVDADPPESAHIVHSVLECAYGVIVVGGYAYVTNMSAGIQVINIYPPETAYLAKSIDTPGSARGIAVYGIYAYVADGSGLRVIDLDPLESACIVNSVPTSCAARGVAVSGDYAYVADYDAGLLIYDIDSPESTELVKSVDTPGSARGIAVSAGYAYVAVSGSGLQVIDIDPFESAHIVCSVADAGSPRGVAVSDGYAYDAAGGLGLQIVNISMPAWAYVVKTVDTPGSARGVAASGGYAYIADHDSGLHIIDVDPPKSAYIINSVVTPDSARGVAVTGGYAFVADFNSGLQIIDIDPPESAAIINSVDTLDSAHGVALSGGFAYIAEYDSGLQIIDIDPLESAFILSTVETPGAAYGVAVSGNYAYVADSSGGLRIIKLW